jgi:hypothetical protein
VDGSGGCCQVDDTSRSFGGVAYDLASEQGDFVARLQQLGRASGTTSSSRWRTAMQANAQSSHGARCRRNRWG